MRFKAFSSLVAASTILVSVLPANAQYYPQRSNSRSSNSTSVHRSGSGSSRTTSTSKSNSSGIRVSLPGITNINRKRDRSSSSSVTRRSHRENTSIIRNGEYRALPYPGISHNNRRNSWDLGSFGRYRHH